MALTPKAHARWVWLTGMMVVSPHLGRYRLTEANLTRPTSECEPDLTDEVTALALPAVVRKAWDRPKAYARPRSIDPAVERWVVRLGDGIVFAGATEAEAWIKALEAAP